MIAISLWKNDEKRAKDATVIIGKRNIYFNGDYIKRGTKICIFMKLSELEEIEGEEFRYVEVNKVIFRSCMYIEIKSQYQYVYFYDKEWDILGYLPIREIDELTLVTTDGVMFIADKQ